MTPTVTPTPTAIRAKIEIVWPHGGASVSDATRANITAYLLAELGNDPVACDYEPVVRLWSALNSAPARPLALGQKRMFSESGRTFPVWDFNDVDVSAARDPSNKISFFVTADTARSFHNVWTHAMDARTLMPQQDVPTGTVTSRLSAVDARIEIVWPHGNLPVDQAARANITAYLFEPETRRAIPPTLGWRPVVRLHWALNADTNKGAASSKIGEPRPITAANGVTFLAWDFNDVDVSAARDPLNKIYFWVSVDEVLTFSNIWAHGVDARTIYPQADLLNSCR
jgi:hypothetical protein